MGKLVKFGPPIEWSIGGDLVRRGTGVWFPVAARAARGGLRDVGQPTEHSGSQIPADQPDEDRHRFWL